MKKLFSILVLLLTLIVITTQAQIDISQRRLILSNALKGTLGTYAAPPLQNGKVDGPTLIKQLKDIHANTYHWLVRAGNFDLNAAKAFLPLAAEANISVWLTLVPPSESPPFSNHFSEPYKLDYLQWAVELSNLSLQHPNLLAWSIDDFVHNLKLYTPSYVKEFLDTSHKINPKFAFLPCCYYKQITPEFVKDYGPILDGILFPYRNESKEANLTDPSHVTSEIETIRNLFGHHFLVYLDIYASPHSKLGKSTPEYLRTALDQGIHSADGIMIYRHQDPKTNPEKYQIVKNGFKKGKKKLLSQTRKRIKG
jgi:hypothetical protein